MYPNSIFLNVCGISENGLDNLITFESKFNEQFLFGGVAATLNAKELGEDTIGFVGGMDILGIYNFLVGYIEGAQWVNPDIKVVPSYVGSFSDPSTAKEDVLFLYKSGISVIYAAASGSKLGLYILGFKSHSLERIRRVFDK